VCQDILSFKELGVCDELCQACEALGWKLPTAIQQQSLPYTLKGRDVIGLAETGSGKTGAFALPVLQSLLDAPKRLFCVVLAPTRELCIQIADQFQSLGAGICLEATTIIGGFDMVTQAMALAKKPHVIVASPGRLADHLENTKGFVLHTVKYLIMDEADKLLSMDFEDALNKILQAVPTKRNTYLFSATMTSRVSKLQRASLRNPVKIQVNSKYDTVKNLIQNYMLIPHKRKWTYVAALLAHLGNYSAMVFTNTCFSAMKVAIFLRHLGFTSVCLHGKMTQPQRIGALNQFKSANKKVLVATEVGSRGLDIPHVEVVVNFDVPMASKDYIHRVGRTARAGKTGRAVTLVTQYDIEAFQRIEIALDRKLEEFSDISEEVVMGYHERAMEANRTSDLEMKEAEEGKGGKKSGLRSTFKNQRSSRLKA